LCVTFSALVSFFFFVSDEHVHDTVVDALETAAEGLDLERCAGQEDPHENAVAPLFRHAKTNAACRTACFAPLLEVLLITMRARKL
jgi:hypothetical protein